MTPLSAVARLVVAVAASCAIAAPASAGRRFVQQQQVGCYTQQAIIQPAYNHVAYPSVTHNFVGLPVRLQAEQAYTMKNDPQWEQFQQWKANQQQQAMAQALFQQWNAAQQQQAAYPAPGSTWTEGQPQTPQQVAAEQRYAATHPGWGPPGQLPNPQQQQQPLCPPGTQCPPAAVAPDGVAVDAYGMPLIPPGFPDERPNATNGATAPGPLPPAAPGVPNAATPNLQPHAAKIPLLVQYCGRCHTAEKPGGGFTFDGSVDYTLKDVGPAGEEMAKKRDQILQAIVSQRMPKDGALDPAVAGAIVAELYSAP